MARIEIDDSLFPILVQRIPAEVGDADVEGMISYFEAFLAKPSTGKHALIIDCAPEHRGLNAVQRKRVAAWTEDLIARGRDRGIITAIVLHSALMRGALVALNWLSPPRRPQKTCATLLEAFDVCIAALNEAGVEVPPNVRVHRNRLARKTAAG